jgi:hypothetical protein
MEEFGRKKPTYRESDEMVVKMGSCFSLVEKLETYSHTFR